MPFNRYVEVGRVVLISYGPDSGKLATIIDIVDQNKCLIDGPETGVARQVIPYTRISLTDLTVKIQRNAREKTLKKAWNCSGCLDLECHPCIDHAGPSRDEEDAHE